MRMRASYFCVCMMGLAFAAMGQEFEAVVIKPNKTLSNSSSTHSNRTQLTGTNVSLRSLIVMAYGVKDYQVEGPEWLRDEHYDLAAKFPGELAANDKGIAMQSMMQKMLADKFKLTMHRETRSLPVYGLVVAKGGIKFKEVPDGDSHNQNNNDGHYVGTCVGMPSFAEFLARRMDAPVVDMTGLKGYYNMTLDFVEARRSADAKGDGPAPDPGALIEQAIQDQLGLRLQTTKAPIEMVIIEHAEKVPIEN